MPTATGAVSSLRPGTKILVRYDEDMRILLGHVAAARWVIVTPDGDMYSEDYGQRDDITGVRMMAGDRLPAGLGAPVYRWDDGDEPSKRELAALIAEGRRLAGLEGGAAEDVAEPSWDAWAWVVAERSCGFSVGDLIPDFDGVQVGERGLLQTDGGVLLAHRVRREDVPSFRKEHSAAQELDARVLAVG